MPAIYALLLVGAAFVIYRWLRSRSAQERSGLQS